MKLSHLALSFSFALSSIASAHNIWLESTSSNQYAIKFGHETTEPYPISKLTHVQLIDAQGNRSDLSPNFIKTSSDKGEANVQIDKGDLVLLEFNNGVWSKLPSGKFVEKTKKEEPTAEFSKNPIKLGKAIFNWHEQALKPQGQVYELVPLSKPEAGKPLQILVLHDGKPIEGIKVGLGEDKPFNLSNAKGIAEFIPTHGFNKVWAEFEEKVANNPDYSDRSYEYMLTFDVP